MGIPQFLNTLKKVYESEWISTDTFTLAKLQTISETNKFDFLIFDFQSLVFFIFEVYGNEINYLIKLLKMYQEVAVDKVDLLEKISYIISYYKSFFLLYDSKFESDIDNLKENKEKITNLDMFLKNIYELDFNLHWNEYLVFKTVELVKELSNTYVTDSDKYNKTYIFFDGIPSYSKIKEQVLRRINPEIIEAINKSIREDSTIPGDVNFEIEYLQKIVKMDKISPNSDLAKKLRLELGKVDDPVKGKFYINNEKIIGEAEHQIMKFINSNHTVFQTKKTLLISPDADLILLSFINKVNNFNIDILKISSKSDKNFDFKLDNYLEYKKGDSPYKFLRELYKIDILLTKMNLLGKNQKIIDLSFILLLLGSDFLPKIPTLSMDNFLDIFNEINSDTETYNILNYDSSQQSYKINYSEFLKFLKNLIKVNIDEQDNIEELWDSTIVETHNKKINSNFVLQNFREYAEKKMLQSQNYNIDVNMYDSRNTAAASKSKFPYQPGTRIEYKFYNIKRYLEFFLENKGLYCSIADAIKNNPPIRFRYYYDKNSQSLKQTDEIDISKFRTLFKKKEKIFPIKEPLNERKIENYLEGCSFILDIYLNNNLKNYEWFYNYDSSPTITEIIKFMKDKDDTMLSTIFNYNKSGKSIFDTLKYLNFETYKDFIDKNKSDAIKKIAKNIITKTIIDPTLQSTALIDLERMDKNKIFETYFTYSNVEHIYECLPDKQNIDKCFEINLSDIKSDSDVEIINGDIIFKQKYLKYKAKYLSLKNKIKKF